ncbi:F0F1 ATP synthase subunit B [Magnetovibrio sp. PR-2]|uniref:F0F1 ATP synthase subunit B family protein n=1 Tax=Magnetovibrio sp. PR-2 TaxID=3120356 RepID=UPI002FCE1B01
MLISQAHAASDAAHAVPFYADTTFLVSLAFVAFFVLFGKKLAAAATAGLDDRAQKIQDSIDEATTLREEAQELLASYEKKQHEALKEAEDIVTAAKDEAERLSKEAAEQLEASLTRSEQLAKDRIAQAEAQAIAEVKAVAVDLAMEATKTVLSKEISEAKADALVDEAIKNLDGKLH